MPHDEIAFAKLLQSRGLRMTRQRLLILDAICEGGGHTTLPAVLARVRRADGSIDQSTVHRTVDLLCDLGIVVASAAGNAETVYELAGDRPHHHLICIVCRRAIEVAEPTMQPMFDDLRRRYGFTVSAKHLLLEGVCADCSG